MPVIQPSLFPHAGRSCASWSALCSDVLSSEAERRLLNRIVDLPFKEFQFHNFEGNRRVVSFGWRYDFSEHKAPPAEHSRFSARIAPGGSESFRFCFAGSGAGPSYGICAQRAHRLAQGSALFRGRYGLSLASACNFRLRKALKEGKWQRNRAPLTFFKVQRAGNGSAAFRPLSLCDIPSPSEICDRSGPILRITLSSIASAVLPAHRTGLYLAASLSAPPGLSASW
jgi:hypothetical protein